MDDSCDGILYFNEATHGKWASVPYPTERQPSVLKSTLTAKLNLTDSGRIHLHSAS